MRLSYCKELEPYSEDELKEKLDLQDRADDYERTIEKLTEKKVLVQQDGGQYCFEFVGVLIFHHVVLFLLPKYVRERDKKATAKQLLSLFYEYSKRESLESKEVESVGDIATAADYNVLSVIIFLLYDYFGNGLYSNEKNVFLFAGEDAIDWQKTIDEVQPIISGGEVLYLDYYTASAQNDEENYFRQLHKYVLNQCTSKLEDLGLIEFFGFEPFAFNVDEDSLGPQQAIISRINIELNTQFNSRKQLLLKAISSFITEEKMEGDTFAVSFYGTRSFYSVWEKTCAYILGNKYAALRKYIAKPAWKTVTGITHEANTLIPDIVSIFENQADKALVITDAKYYDIELTDTNLSKNPGVEDISKQYLYRLAFKAYCRSRNYNMIWNILLFPGEKDVMEDIGNVSIDFLKALELEDIRLIRMPAHIVFDLYIASEKIDLEKYVDLEIAVIR